MAKKSDLIHGTIFNGAFPTWFASKVLRKKSVLSVHEVWVGKWKQLTEMSGFNAWIHDILERMIYVLNFDKYITISDSTTNQLKGVGKTDSHIEQVYCGVDYDHWNSKKYDGIKIKKDLGLNNHFVYLFTGRPGFSKGLEYLIKAVPEISKNIPNAKFLALVSKDKDYKKRYDYILKLIDELGIKDKVIMHDPVPYNELPNYIKAADCVVVPSLAEGFGFTTAEACAMGKPVVASNTTSLPEVVSGNYVLVKPKSFAGIAKGVEMVYNNKTLYRPFRKFGLNNFLDGYIQVYKNLLKLKRK